MSIIEEFYIKHIRNVVSQYKLGNMGHKLTVLSISNWYRLAKMHRENLSEHFESEYLLLRREIDIKIEKDGREALRR